MKKELFKSYGSCFALVLTLLCLLHSCSKNSLDNDIVFQYPSDAFEVNFQSEEVLPAPFIEWPDEKGTFALQSAIKGLAIDETTGAISIEKNLALGEQEVVVYAISSEGAWTTTFTLKNVLKNAFLFGGESNQPNSMFAILLDKYFTLHENGTLEMEIKDQENSTGVGVWSFVDGTFKMHFCTYCEDMDPLDVPAYDEHAYYEGYIDYDEEDNNAHIRGQWYVVRLDPDSTNLRGDFILVWDWN